MAGSSYMPEDSAKQWDVLLMLISSEEKKVDFTGETEIDVATNFYNTEGIRKIFQHWLNQMHSTYGKHQSETDSSIKSDILSITWRHKGNELFKEKQYRPSYDSYSKSVLYAKQESPTYSLALANRSAASIQLKRYEDCLRDIDLSLKCGYPPELSHKLYLRKAEAYIALKDEIHTKETLDKAVKHLSSYSLNGDRKRDFDEKLAALEKELSVMEGKELVTTPSYLIDENPAFVYASTALEIKHSEQSGRYVVCKSEVQRGNVLFVEDPYAFVALPVQEDMPVVCEYCCKADLNIVPCSECAKSVYCSEECRKRGWDTFHRWECVGAQDNIWPTIGIAHLALRVLLISTNNGYPPTNHDRSKPVTTAEIFQHYTKMDNIQIYRNCEQAFFRLFHLVTNFDKINNTDYIQYALTAVTLTIYLDKFTKYFEYLPSKLPFKMSELEMRVFVSSLLLRHMGQLVCNGHAVMALHETPEGDRISSETEVRIATAIYPSASVMNHSCDPNIINSFDRNRLVVKASRTIGAGEEVCNCYGPQASRQPYAQRRDLLRRQYHFTCACDACTDQDRRDQVMLFTAYMCHLCKGPVIIHKKTPHCKQCKSTGLDLEKTINVLNKADDLMKQADVSLNAAVRCERLSSALKLKQQVLHRHHMDIRDTMDRLAFTYAQIGEYTKSIEMTKQCIPSLEYQFGSFSFEVAHELRKLAGVMLMNITSVSNQHKDYRSWCLETHKITKKALQLFELNYGPWDTSYKQLKQDETVMKSFIESTTTSDDSVHSSLHYNLKI